MRPLSDDLKDLEKRPYFICDEAVSLRQFEDRLHSAVRLAKPHPPDPRT